MDNPLHIGALTVGTVPRVAAIVDRVLAPERLRELGQRGAQLLEVRVDCLDLCADELCRYIEEVRSLSGLAVIGTIRETSSNRENRLALFERITPLVDAVDIEIDAPFRDRVIAGAQEKSIIVSEHDYEATPPTPRIQELVDEAMDAGASMVKLAFFCATMNDSVRLLQFCRHCPHPLVVIGMGECGTITRLVAPLFGSLFTFAFLHESVAPGQIGLEQMVADMTRYFPQFVQRVSG